LATSRVESINDLAKKLRRNVKNVYQDLQILRKMGFVKLTKRRGRAIIPETLVREIAFIIR
jgi:predicted transcriptional regulator